MLRFRQRLCGLALTGGPRGRMRRRRQCARRVERSPGYHSGRRLQHGIPHQRSGRRGVPEGESERPGHGRNFGHRRRVPEVLPRRDRYQRRIETDPSRRNRCLSEGRNRVHRAADRLRRPGGRRQSQEHLGRIGDRRGAEDAVGARSAGQGPPVEPGSRLMAEPRDSALRRRRRFRDLRLLHRGHRRQRRRQPR